MRETYSSNENMKSHRSSVCNQLLNKNKENKK